MLWLLTIFHGLANSSFKVTLIMNMCYSTRVSNCWSWSTCLNITTMNKMAFQLSFKLEFNVVRMWWFLIYMPGCFFLYKCNVFFVICNTRQDLKNVFFHSYIIVLWFFFNIPNSYTYKYTIKPAQSVTFWSR